MMIYSQDLIKRFQKLYKVKFGEKIDYETAKMKLYFLARLVDTILPELPRK